MMNPRSKAFLEELPKNGNKIKPSAIKAGYSPIYAHANGKQILKTALKEKAKDIIDTIDNKPLVENKKAVYELIGLTEQDVYKALKNIALNERDYASALKVLGVLSKPLGISIIQDDSPKITVPVLNIGVREVENRLIEPQNTEIIQGDAQ